MVVAVPAEAAANPSRTVIASFHGLFGRDAEVGSAMPPDDDAPDPTDEPDD